MTTKRVLFSSTIIAGLAAFSLAPGLAAAQSAQDEAVATSVNQPAPSPENENDEPAQVPGRAAVGNEVEGVVVTGSRLRQTEFTSAQPIQVLSAERADQRGVADTGQLLQSSTLAAGSPQVNPTISSAFVTEGGPGASTVSLRGLGANRTLVLLNGRRVGPAGTRGGVSSVDLNVIPQSAVQRVEILKDGASSIYGSDAVAGVVNIITKRERDGGEVSAYYTEPFEGQGEQMNFSASYGKTFSRGAINFAFDYYKHNEQQNGARSYTQCAEQYIFNQNGGGRADRLDPRTNSPACLDLLWGHVWVYGANFSTRPGKFQFDYDGNLGQFIPPRPPGTRNGTCPTGAARATDPDCYPYTNPPGFFLVGYDPLSTALQNANHPFEDAASLIPEIERTTFFMDGTYDLTSEVEAYGEILLNRRESRTTGFRQYWTYNYTSDFFDYFYGPGSGGDPFSVGFTGPFILSPTPLTNHFGAAQIVDYSRVVGGVRGTLPSGPFANWDWDIFVQHSVSDGDYIQDVILADAAESQSFRTGPCAGQILPVSGRTCMDINFADPQVLAGNLTPEQEAFLFDVDVGNTLYTQTFVEGFFGGQMFNLPAGPIGAAVGFALRRDEINDVPGEITRNDNSYLLSSAGITKGTDTTREVFGELALPILRGAPLAHRVDLQLSGRYTDVRTSGSANTYKAGLNWAFTPEYKVRLTHGTSFRAPALFELYLAEQTSFPSQKTVDPCIGWETNLAQGFISQRLANNCANPAGPGGGVPGDHSGAGSSSTLIQRGGLGRLKPETSEATSIGVIWTPAFADLAVAVDYFEINIEDEVTSLGSNIPLACYLSESFPTDPVCGLFVRNPGTKRIDTITSEFINISEQENRGIDLTVRYRRDLPWNIGSLQIDSQATWQLEDTIALFADNQVETNNEVGDPSFVANINFTLERGPWTAFYGVDMVGPQNNYGDYGSKIVTVSGVDYDVKAHAEFTAFHAASVKYDFDRWDASILVGVANIFDEHPPALTTINASLGEYSTVGTSALTSQYTEGYYGRRGFVRVSKSF